MKVIQIGADRPLVDYTQVCDEESNNTKSMENMTKRHNKK